MDAAAAAYAALTASGTDALLMAADHALRRELSRRIRDDLIRLGLVEPGPAVTIADGAQASPGDLIICTRNDHPVEAGEPGRTLANGDLLRIDAITADGLLVRRALDADPRTGQRRWTDRQFLYADYHDAELGYAVTDHAAQGRTVHTGLAVITGTEDRQHAYVALTRGTDANTAYVFTASPKRADPAPGPRPAPELARYDRLHAERAAGARPAHRAAPPGRRSASSPASWTATASSTPPPRPGARPWPTPTTWPSCTRSGPPRPPPPATSATATCSPHALPPGYRAEPGHQAKWLWRTLRAAELAGLDPAQVLADAIAERDLAGARDIPAVIDARIRHRLGPLVPLPPGPWSAQVPAIADPERRAYVTEIAALMDARKDRIGEHAAEPRPALGRRRPRPGPRPPADRLDWQQRAASIGAYRELSGYDHPADPIGPEPAAAAPDPRAAWHEALAALGPLDGPDVRGMPDGQLLHLRDTYPVETAWAPHTSATSSARSAPPPATPTWPPCAPTPKPSPPGRAATTTRPPATHALAASYQALQRRLPAARDRLRRRHGRPRRLGARHPRPAPPGRRRRRRTPPPPPRPALPAAALRRTRARHRRPARRAHPDPGPAIPARSSQWIKDLAAGHRTFADKLADRQSLAIPSEDPDYGDLGQAFPAWTAPARADPPAAQTRDPAVPRVLERVLDRDADREAAD